MSASTYNSGIFQGKVEFGHLAKFSVCNILKKESVYRVLVESATECAIARHSVVEIISVNFFNTCCYDALGALDGLSEKQPAAESAGK